MSDTLEIGGLIAASGRMRAAAFVELAKPRILFLVLVATASGFYLGLPLNFPWGLSLGSPLGMDGSSWLRLVHVILGTALVVAGSNALNQYLEVPHDARMARTADRPLPSGRLNGSEALAFGAITGVVGVLYLALTSNLVTGMLAALSFLNYVFVYTPLKRRTTFCVYVGAVSGALPPVIGWSAAVGSVGVEAWLLFGILFLWQLPHFSSIAWLYREDYARAGYAMIPVVDQRGIRSDMHLITHTVALLAVSLLPALRGTSGPMYALGAMGLGAAFLAFGALFVGNKTPRMARCHVLASIVYLPLLFATMMLDKALAP